MWNNLCNPSSHWPSPFYSISKAKRWHITTITCYCIPTIAFYSGVKTKTSEPRPVLSYWFIKNTQNDFQIYKGVAFCKTEFGKTKRYIQQMLHWIQPFITFSIYLYLSSKLRETEIIHCYGLCPLVIVNNISKSIHLSLYPKHLKFFGINLTKNTDNRPV